VETYNIINFLFSYSTFLDHVKNAFILNPQLKNLLMDEYFIKTLADFQMSWRRVIVTAINHGIPAPAFSAALSYYDSFRCPRLPANLLQVYLNILSLHSGVSITTLTFNNYLFFKGPAGFLRSSYI
jgi:6-phosphogluconate dehydrogenase